MPVPSGSCLQKGDRLLDRRGPAERDTGFSRPDIRVENFNSTVLALLVGNHPFLSRSRIALVPQANFALATTSYDALPNEDFLVRGR
jgi:hypothetical protein